MLRSIQHKSFAEINIDKSFSLGEVSDNFEVLNTAGTPVSAVDVVHSVLYDWYKSEHSRDFELRDWIDEICDSKESKGWGRPERRNLSHN